MKIGLLETHPEIVVICKGALSWIKVNEETFTVFATSCSFVILLVLLVNISVFLSLLLNCGIDYKKWRMYRTIATACGRYSSHPFVDGYRLVEIMKKKKRGRKRGKNGEGYVRVDVQDGVVSQHVVDSGGTNEFEMGADGKKDNEEA
ncbi:MAG: hypothetical protein ACTSUE_04150 [Promethearchaeota archaeon]